MSTHLRPLQSKATRASCSCSWTRRPKQVWKGNTTATLCRQHRQRSYQAGQTAAGPACQRQRGRRPFRHGTAGRRRNGIPRHRPASTGEWARVNAQARGSTALHAASVAGHAETVQLLLAHRADVHAQSKNWGGPLEAASYSDNIEIALLLLGHRADVNAPG
jgi:hypothetical protein